MAALLAPLALAAGTSGAGYLGGRLAKKVLRFSRAKERRFVYP